MSRRGTTSEAIRKAAGPVTGELHPTSTMVERMRAKDRRVMHVLELMQRDEYRGTETAVDLAEQWHLAVPSVESLAAEAGRIRRLLGTVEHSAEWCLAQLHLLIESTDSDAVKVAAIKVMLDRQPQSHSKNEVAYIPTHQEQVKILMRELADPGPELAEALRRMGVVLPLRAVVETEARAEVEGGS